MITVDLEFGTLIRTGLKLIHEAKWSSALVHWRKDFTTPEHLTTSLSSPISIDSASTHNSSKFYYSHFRGKGRDMLAKALGTDDPFRMLPYEILQRVLARGEPPQGDCWQANLWRDTGQVYEIRLATRDFLVAISRGTEEIHVQEVRADAQPSIERSRSGRRSVRRPRSAPCKIKPSLIPVAVQTAIRASL